MFLPVNGTTLLTSYTLRTSYAKASRYINFVHV